MNSTNDCTQPSQRLAGLGILFSAVATLAAAPGTARAEPPPPPIRQFCDPGSWSLDGKTPCNLATAGYFVAQPGATGQTPAPLGSYVDSVGATSAKLVPLGNYVDSVAASAPKLAPRGHYVNTIGAAASIAAPLGSYVNTLGASAFKLAPPGSYVDTLGASTAKLAPLGSYVDTVGASSTKLAPLGSYVDSTGASAAKPAPLGSYVDTAGASAAKLAPAGNYVDRTGQAAPLAAQPGRFAAGLGNAASTACPTGTNAYGAGSACRIIQQAYQGAGVTPRLGSTYGTQGSHDLGPVKPGDSFIFNVTNTTTDLASTVSLTNLTLRHYTLSDPTLFDLVGFVDGMELTSGTFANLSLRAKAGLLPGPFSFSLTLDTDQFADYRTAGQQFTYLFTGTSVKAVPEPASVALLALGIVGLGCRRLRSKAPG